MIDPRLDDLLQSWSEERDRGRKPSAEQLCRACPELADALSERIAIVERFEQLVDVDAAEPTLGVQRGDTSQSSLDSMKNAAAPLPAALGDFEPKRVLGEGGMGTVYLAVDARLHRPVAIKVMKKELAVKAESRERFLREARSMAAIEHDHIMTIYAVDEQDDVPFLVMPVLQGESLDTRLKRLGRLPMAQACRIGREIASGLAAAHARGLIHRDVKPSNIWLAMAGGEEPASDLAASERTEGGATPTEGRVKLLDFGLALAAEGQQHLTASGAVLGTPAYMAPEQAEGLSVDRRCDLFSLGCVLYQMTTGQRPFSGASVMAVLHSLANHSPRPPRELNAALPPALSDLILRLLAKNPSQRPASAQVVVDALAAIETHLAASPSAHVDSSLNLLTAPRTRRGRWPRVLIGMSLLFVAGMVAWSAYQLVFRTPDGALIVEIEDKDVEARFKNGELHIVSTAGKQYILKPSERNKRLPPGQYKIEVRGADGLKVDVERFVLEQNGKATVIVQFDRRGLASRVAKETEPRTNGKLLFEDNYDSGTPKATSLFGDRFLSFQHVGGEGRVIGRAPGLLPLIYPKEKLRDFLLEFEFTAPDANDTRQYGLVFRSAHDATLGLPSYYALFINPHKGTAVFDCWLEGKWIANRPLSVPANLLIPRGSNHVRLEAVGPEFRFFINKTLVGRHEDRNLPEAGIVGFFVFSDDARENPVFLRDLRVYGVILPTKSD